MLTGRCECGAVEYAVADEFLYAANCHCSRCRAATGSAFKAFAGIERGKLDLRRGADGLFVYGTDTLHDTRCSVCGAIVTASGANEVRSPTVIAVRVHAA